jgi:hypothetical protein
MPDPRFIQALIVGWQPDGMAVLLRFKCEDESQIDLWVRTAELPEVLLLMQSATERASAIAASVAGGTRKIRVLRVAKLSASHTDDHTPFVEVTFESGLSVHMEMGNSTARAFAGALDHLKQNKLEVVKN